mgnify:CR=1 FL=1
MIEVGVENGTATATNLTLENMTIDAEAQDIRCIRVCPESQLTLENGATGLQRTCSSSERSFRKHRNK